MLRNVLKDNELEDKFIKDGFVIVPALKEDEVKTAWHDIVELKSNAFSGNQSDIVNVPYHSTFFENDKQYKLAVFNRINKLFAPLISRYLNSYKLIQGSIFNKQPGTGFVCPHQNLTTVDEDKYTSVSIWTPLYNTTVANGALYVAPGSHRKFSKYRNYNIDWEPLKIFDRIEDYNMIPIQLSPCEVVIFDDSLIHGSPDNNTTLDRIAFHSLAIPIETSPVFCQKTSNGINVIEVPDDFWIYFTPGNENPVGPIVKTVEINKEYFTQQTIQSLLRK